MCSFWILYIDIEFQHFFLNDNYFYDSFLIFYFLVCRAELISDGDSPEEIDVLLSEIDDRMNDIETLLSDTERRLNLSHASHEFYEELSELQKQLEVYEAWLNKKRDAEDYVEAVTRQMRSMKSLDERIKALSNRIAEFQCQDWPEFTQQIEEDFSAFNTRWLQTFDQYSKCVLQISCDLYFFTL